MSSRRASPAGKGDQENLSPERGDHGDENEPPRVAGGSIYTKLFAKETRQHAAVDANDHVEAHENGESNGDTAGLTDEYEDEVNGTGVGDEQDVEDDEDDDEYDPNDASDAESSGESDDSGSDLDDEETSMRSLLLPVAAFAKQLLFLSDEEDNGEFNDQDAELWGSEDEKRAWIAQYEARNREYVERYGCRIDSSAMPDVKRKLRRERKREAKYSVVLVALAVAYFIRLMAGAPASTVTVAPISTPTERPTVTAPEIVSATQEQTKATSSPLWWTVWTEDLVVRVVTWPSQYFKSKTEVITAKHPARSLPAQTPESKVANEASQAVEKEEVVPQKLERVEEVIQHEVKIESATEDVSMNGGLTGSSGTEQQHTQETKPTDAVDDAVGESTTIVDIEVETEVIEVEVVVDSAPTSLSTPSARAPREGTEADPSAIESASEETPEESVGGDVAVDTEGHDVVHHSPTTAELLADCFDLFHKLIKTKNNPDLKVAAIEACNAAVQSAAADQDPSTEWIQAHVLRGDLKSLLYKFEEARADYETAITHATTMGLPLESRDTIELKLAANRWIELYQTKSFKELRSECERIVDASWTQPSNPRDHLQGIAADWLRVFKREKPLMDVLIKTRAWTINPLKLH